MADDCEGIPSCCDENWFQYQACCPVPVVSAGENQEVEVGSGIVFSGTASDYQTVEWTQISGPEITIQNPSTLTASIEAFHDDGTYVFRLTAFNQCGSDYSDVTVMVQEIPIDCCAYPWPGPANARFYESDDLPETVLLNMEEPLFENVLLTRDGYVFVNEELSLELTPNNDQQLWFLHQEDVGFSFSGCLLGEYVEGGPIFTISAFPVELRLTNTEWDESIIMERVSNCRWEEIGPDNILYGVQYTGFVWVVTQEGGPDVPRTDPPEMSQPDGTYGDFTVSQV